MDIVVVYLINSGEYSLYAFSSSLNSGVRMRVVLYSFPVLSYVLASLMGRYSAYHAPE